MSPLRHKLWTLLRLKVYHWDLSSVLMLFVLMISDVFNLCPSLLYMSLYLFSSQVHKQSKANQCCWCLRPSIYVGLFPTWVVICVHLRFKNNEKLTKSHYGSFKKSHEFGSAGCKFDIFIPWITFSWKISPLVIVHFGRCKRHSAVGCLLEPEDRRGR